MALILAVNPGSAHNPTLSRLARELQGCEIVGAESCAVAIKAIKKRVPDVLLLPASRPRGEADLRAHLRRIPGGVPTLTLPPVETADPLDLVRQIRELLAGTSSLQRSTPARARSKPAPVRPAPAPVRSTQPAPVRDTPAPVRSTPATANAPVPAPVPRETAPVSASPHVLAAGAAAVTWIRARRAQWSETFEPYNFAPSAPVSPVASNALIAPSAPNVPLTASSVAPEYYEPIELANEPTESYEPAGPGHGSDDASDSTGIARFLPRAAAIAVAVGIIAAGAWYWSQADTESRSALQTAATSREPSSPVESVPPAPAAETPAQPLPELEATIAPPAPVPVPVTIVSPFEVSISEGERPVPVDAQGRVMLVPGKHRLRLQNNERKYDETRTVQVIAGRPATLAISAETTIAVTSNEPAEVLIDGTPVGDTPYEGRVSVGAHTVTVRTAGAERQLNVDAASSPIKLEVDFSKP